MMIDRLRRTLVEQRGVSLVEAMVGVVILAIVLLGLAAAGGVAARQVDLARADMRYWIAIQAQMETLLHTKYDSLETGSATVQSYPVSWTVTETDPKRIELMIEHANYARQTVEDTFVMFVQAPGPLFD